VIVDEEGFMFAGAIPDLLWVVLAVLAAVALLIWIVRR